MCNNIDLVDVSVLRHEIEDCRNVGFTDLIKAPRHCCRFLSDAASQIRDPNITSALPQVTCEIRIHGMMSKGCTSCAVAVKHHNRLLTGVRISREPDVPADLLIA